MSDIEDLKDDMKTKVGQWLFIPAVTLIMLAGMTTIGGTLNYVLKVDDKNEVEHKELATKLEVKEGDQRLVERIGRMELRIQTQMTEDKRELLDAIKKNGGD